MFHGSSCRCHFHVSCVGYILMYPKQTVVCGSSDRSDLVCIWDRLNPQQVVFRGSSNSFHFVRDILGRLHYLRQTAFHPASGRLNFIVHQADSSSMVSSSSGRLHFSLYLKQTVLHAIRYLRQTAFYGIRYFRQTAVQGIRYLRLHFMISVISDCISWYPLSQVDCVSR